MANDDDDQQRTNPHRRRYRARLAALRRSEKIPQSGKLDDVLSRQDGTH
jgi:hypothetical protein